MAQAYQASRPAANPHRALVRPPPASIAGSGPIRNSRLHSTVEKQLPHAAASKRKGKADKPINFVVANTRQSTTMMQHKVVVTASWRPDEVEWRQALTGGNPDKAFGPPTVTDSALLKPMHGLPAMMVGRRGGSLRTSLGNYAPIHVVSNTNGLPRDQGLFLPCFIQNEKAHEGNKQVTCAVEGTDTVINYHDETIQAGDALYIDPFPVICADDKPFVRGPAGIDHTVQNFRLRPCNPVQINSSIREMEKRLMALFGADQTQSEGGMSFSEKLKSLDTFDKFKAYLDDKVEEFFRVDSPVSQGDPSRLYAKIWLWFTLGFGFQALLADQRVPGELVFFALQGLIGVLREAETLNANEGQKFDSFFPQIYQERVGVHSTTATALFGQRADVFLEAHTSNEVKSEELLFFSGLLAMLGSSTLTAFVQRIYDFKSRYLFGIALTCAAPGEKMDVYVGRLP